jgi:hypothetical protein
MKDYYEEIEDPRKGKELDLFKDNKDFTISSKDKRQSTVDYYAIRKGMAYDEWEKIRDCFLRDHNLFAK